MNRNQSYYCWAVKHYCKNHQWFVGDDAIAREWCAATLNFADHYDRCPVPVQITLPDDMNMDNINEDTNQE